MLYIHMLCYVWLERTMVGVQPNISNILTFTQWWYILINTANTAAIPIIANTYVHMCMHTRLVLSSISSPSSSLSCLVSPAVLSASSSPSPLLLSFLSLRVEIATDNELSSQESLHRFLPVWQRETNLLDTSICKNELIALAVALELIIWLLYASHSCSGSCSVCEKTLLRNRGRVGRQAFTALNGRFPKFHRVFSGRDTGTLKSDIVSKRIHN